MMKRMLKILSIFIFGLAFSVLSVSAAEIIDFDKNGSLTITVHDHDRNPVPGGTLTIYHVASIQYNDGNAEWVLTEDFAGSNADLSQPENRNLVAYLEDYAAKHNMKGITYDVGPTATLTFPDIPLGLYLVCQHQAAEGYHAMASFLISIPNNEDGEYVYDVSAYPKSDPSRLKEPEDKNPPKGTTQKPGTGLLEETLWPTICLIGTAGLLTIVYSRKK